MTASNESETTTVHSTNVSFVNNTLLASLMRNGCGSLSNSKKKLTSPPMYGDGKPWIPIIRSKIDLGVVPFVDLHNDDCSKCTYLL